MAEKIRVVIVDDSPETRENVRKLLQFERDVEVVAQAGDGEQAIEIAKQHQPDVILMDINMPGTNYNPPYYKDLFEAYGFQVYFEQLFFKRSADVPAQPIFRRKYEQLMRDPDIKMHDSVGRTVVQIAEDLRTVYNAAWVDHDNHKEMDAATALKLVKTMAPIMDRRLLIFIRHKDVPIAMYISVPELNEAFKYIDGNLNWWGKLKFLYYKKRGVIKSMTGIVFGVAKEFQGKGVEGALITYSDHFID